MPVKSIHRSEYKDLLELLREIRKKADLTQTDLAKLLGRSQSYVSEVECGVRRIDLLQLRDFCLACGQDPTAFVRRFEKAINDPEDQSST
ncbi:helix-turn-helix domain-containing protein [Luteimonas sp. R10]|uniref:helix-turn-helix domain-containing protein n=1 Tax=Luteimonas sp. R10 TaxID=3108176 RepID=UPI003093561B|nr:helix-turn-helix transcriptional regulator [Luteimonas sp. R10]